MLICEGGKVKSTMLSGVLMAGGAAIIGLLGIGHFVLTFRGSKLLPRDRSVMEAMRRTSPVITTQTTIWNAWIGFNASHSMGAILFGLVYGYLAIARAEILFGSPFLQLVGLAMVGGFVALARRYWFITPLIGSSLALTFYVASIVAARLD